jgi:hypothetical protein
MSNKNFGEPWEGKIERIRENLREGRYALEDGILPIVKELVQNAEDARAGRLLIAWNEGLQEARHRLLRGPALLAINDGGFDTANSRAIREMGLSSKAADSSSIGKFGLGMKSVFHIGEAFFFVAVGEDDRRIDADTLVPSPPGQIASCTGRFLRERRRWDSLPADTRTRCVPPGTAYERHC